jgi:hypothetical protein
LTVKFKSPILFMMRKFVLGCLEQTQNQILMIRRTRTRFFYKNME